MLLIAKNNKRVVIKIEIELTTYTNTITSDISFTSKHYKPFMFHANANSLRIISLKVPNLYININLTHLILLIKLMSIHSKKALNDRLSKTRLLNC